jgi:hypothetical protein
MNLMAGNFFTKFIRVPLDILIGGNLKNAVLSRSMGYPPDGAVNIFQIETMLPCKSGTKSTFSLMTKWNDLAAKLTAHEEQVLVLEVSSDAISLANYDALTVLFRLSGGEITKKND